MTGFVDLMGTSVPTEQQILAHTEARVRETGFSLEEELVLLRDLVGLFGSILLPQVFPPPPPIDPARVQQVGTMLMEQRAYGAQLRHDAALLRRVLDAESGTAELPPDDAEGLELLAQRAALRPAEPEPDEQPEPGSGSDPAETEGEGA